MNIIAKLPSLRGQKVLITGGLGFIGSNLAHKCLELNAEVTIYDCLDPKSGGNMYNLHGIKDSLNIILNDIRNFEGVCSAVINHNLVFNCAAYTSHPNSMREPLIDIDINCKGTINLLEAARRFNPLIKIVHVGTSTQIGRMHYNPIDERHPEYPVDIYSANKSASEKYVLIYGNAYHIPVTVIRLANVYGPRSNIKISDFGFMNYFIGLALQKKDINVFGSGKQLRNITYVEDCVDALILAAQNEEANGRALFAVSDRQYTVSEIAEGLVKHIGGTVKFVEWPRDRSAIEIGDAVISNKEIKRLLKWQPKYILENGLAETKEFYARCLEKYLR